MISTQGSEPSRNMNMSMYELWCKLFLESALVSGMEDGKCEISFYNGFLFRRIWGTAGVVVQKQ